MNTYMYKVKSTWYKSSRHVNNKQFKQYILTLKLLYLLYKSKTYIKPVYVYVQNTCSIIRVRIIFTSYFLFTTYVCKRSIFFFNFFVVCVSLFPAFHSCRSHHSIKNNFIFCISSHCCLFVAISSI